MSLWAEASAWLDDLPNQIQALAAWFRAYPVLSVLLVGVVSFGEALAVIGLAVPGTILLFTLGALIGIDAIGFVPAVIACAVGAFLGDAVSFAAGRYVGPPVLEHQKLKAFHGGMRLVKDYIDRFGGLALIFGRFFGPTRAFVCLLAGAFSMRWMTFLIAAPIACLIWAPAYLLPGIAFGGSIQAAGDAAPKFVAILVGLLALGFGLRFLLRYATRTVAEPWHLRIDIAAVSIAVLVSIGFVWHTLEAPSCTNSQTCAKTAIDLLLQLWPGSNA
jgi:membrane protein DedA with SNARE-associated domain